MTEFVARSATPPTPRSYAGVNWLGLWTLYKRELKRFWKVGVQTLGAPVATALLYMMVFVVAVRGAQPGVHGVAFSAFVAPGLIMMQILNNAFANSSSSLVQARLNGSMGDFLTPPLTPAEHVAAFSLGAATRGVLVGVVTWLAILPFADMSVAHPWAVVFFGFSAAMILGLVGVMAGLWATKPDHMAAVTNFVIMPLTFLSGTFYLVDRLPEPFRSFSHVNPFFYMIDGFRYGFIGHAESSLPVGVLMTLALLGLTTWGCLWMFRTGYNTKT